MKPVHYTLGAGPHSAKRFEHPDGSVKIRLTGAAINGHGATAQEAARHLAEQLREIARLVEAHEGLRP